MDTSTNEIPRELAIKAGELVLRLSTQGFSPEQIKRICFFACQMTMESLK